jgi:hypothetical protein
VDIFRELFFKGAVNDFLEKTFLNYLFIGYFYRPGSQIYRWVISCGEVELIFWLI